MPVTTRRPIFSMIGVAVSALLVVSLASSAVAIESDEPAAAAAPTLVGTPREVLIENQHAVGKVLEIGNSAAQNDSAPTGARTAAAASFTLGTTAAGLLAQRVFVYPVLAVQNAVLLANADGELLVRRPNSGSDFRYLSVSTATLDEAAIDPYAQWNIVDAGNGLSAINSVQRDSANRVPSLDMYNWANANGAEIQTYDAGTAAVQRWRIHPLTATVTNPAARVILPGSAPTLPTSVDARYTWGRTVTLTPITWQRPDDSVWLTDGQIDVVGTGVGYFGEPVTVTAKFTVGSLGDPAESVLTTYAGVSVRQLQMVAPTQLQRPVSGSSTTVATAVRWDWTTLTDAALATAGTVTVQAAAGQGFAATLRIQVGAGTSVNLLRRIVSRPVATHIDGTFKLTDGSRTVNGFSDWRSGGATNRVNPNTVTLYLDAPQQITGVGVFDQGGTNNIGRVTVQVRDVRGGWVNLPARGVTWPVTNTPATLDLVLANDPMLVTAVRVKITSKSTATWMTLSEIELYGPAAAL